MMLKLVLIVLGGGAGSLCRYGVASLGQRLAPGVFPLGTLVVNAIGCLVIGALAAAFSGPFLIREEYRIGIMIGFLGGFTTFSTYGFETFSLMNDGQRWAALGNVLLSNGICLALVWIGYRFAEKLYGV